MAETDQARNIKLVIAYHGAAYHGWQRQADGIDTIQQRIEDTAARILGHPVIAHGAGRTDAGVHALGQVANLPTANRSVPLRGLRRAMNSRLPADINVRSAAEAPADFHSSRSAVGKTYRYRVCLSPQSPLEHRTRCCYCRTPLDVARMSEAGRRLLGRHDFRGFATSAETRQNTIRTILRCEVSRDDYDVCISVAGDGFLYNMVRNIAGTLIDIGRGRWSPDRMDKILASADRRDAGPTAVAQGLSLVCVHYRREDLTLSPAPSTQ